MITIGSLSHGRHIDNFTLFTILQLWSCVLIFLRICVRCVNFGGSVFFCIILAASVASVWLLSANLHLSAAWHSCKHHDLTPQFVTLCDVTLESQECAHSFFSSCCYTFPLRQSRINSCRVHQWLTYIVFKLQGLFITSRWGNRVFLTTPGDNNGKYI